VIYRYVIDSVCELLEFVRKQLDISFSMMQHSITEKVKTDISFKSVIRTANFTPNKTNSMTKLLVIGRGLLV
jgi:hypothetical protein